MTRIINRDTVDKIYTHDHAIEDCYTAFSILSAKKYIMPVRTTVKTTNQNILLMPSAVNEEDKTTVAVKILNICEGNRARGLPLIQGKVCLFDELTGHMNALLDGFMVTFKRTGAVGGSSAKLLHPAPAENAIIFGCGAQGSAGLDSILFAHPEIKTVHCFDFYVESAKSFVKRYSDRNDGRAYLLGTDDNKEEIVRKADIIHCATTSKEALFKGDWIKEGAHISAIGCYRLDMRELPNEIFQRPNVRLFIDDFDAMHEEAGDLMDAINTGVLKEDSILEFGNVVNKQCEGRQNEKQITIVKMVGVAVQDTVAADTIYRLATEQNAGVMVDI